MPGNEHRLHLMSYPVSWIPGFVKLLMHVVHHQNLYVCSGTALASRCHLPGTLLKHVNYVLLYPYVKPYSNLQIQMLLGWLFGEVKVVVLGF